MDARDSSAARAAALCTILGATLNLACGLGNTAPAGADGSALSFTRISGVPVAEDRASTGGVSWIDYDGDGDLDLYVTNGYNVTAPEAVPQGNRLYENLGDGELRPVETGPLVQDSGFSSGSAWADYDNDGDPDVFVSNQRGQDNFLYRNRGDGTFERVEEGPPVSDGGHSYSASWADVDGDGWVDLFVSNGGLSRSQRNDLYRNRGDGTFVRITDGPVVQDSAATRAAAWGDYDDDGDQDLFVANGWSPGREEGPGMSRLYRNDGDWRFTRVPGFPSADTLIAMSAAWGDYDSDGDLDLYVTSRTPANRLYRNDGPAGFHRIEGDPSVLDGGSSSAGTWGDIDNDGDLDLVVPHWGAALILYENDGSGGFRRAEAGDLGSTREHPGNLALGDYDGDGDLDVYVGNWPNWPGSAERNVLYRNDSQAGGWLAVRLVGSESNRSGIGARVTVRARIDGRSSTRIRELGTQTSFRSQEGLRLHFGLGDAAEIEELVVRWPSGTVQRHPDVPLNRVVTVTEGGDLTF